MANDPVIIDVVGPHRPLPEELPSTIRFHGRVSLREASRWYDQADVFVLPTRSDGFAITQLEAMSHGLPVITTQCCGSVVRDGVNGLVVEAGNVGELASAMRRLAHDHQFLESLRSHAKETIGRFSLGVLGSNLEKVESRWTEGRG
jgi:glycosyltransferase involved in cell wall biosynthesis